MRVRDDARWLLGLAACLVALTACATTGARAPSASAPSTAAIDYYPLLPTWGWAYQVERDGVEVLALYAVAESGKDGAVVKNGEQRIAYAILPDGIARREAGAVGDYVLRSPVSLGRGWPVTDGTAKIVEVGKTVVLPSGTYAHCLVVEEVRQGPSRITRTSYCMGVGPVEIEMSVFNPMKASFETVVRARLMSVSHADAAESTP